MFCCLTASTARALLCMEFRIQMMVEAAVACPEPEHVFSIPDFPHRLHHTRALKGNCDGRPRHEQWVSAQVLHPHLTGCVNSMPGRLANVTHCSRQRRCWLDPTAYDNGASGAGIMEADDRQVTTVFTVQPSFHHRHSTNRVS